jgi:hypothetical protein
MNNESEFLNKLDELSLELKKLSNRDKKLNTTTEREIAKNALDNIDEIDKTLLVLDQLIKEKDILATKIQITYKIQIEIEALKCYKDKLLNARKEWILVAETNLKKIKPK